MAKLAKGMKYLLTEYPQLMRTIFLKIIDKSSVQILNMIIGNIEVDNNIGATIAD